MAYSRFGSFILQALLKRSLGLGDLSVEVGTATFATTGTTVEVTTDHDEIVAAFGMPKTVTYSANDQISSDGVVTSNAVTFARNSSGTSGLSIYYILIGRKLTTAV